MSDWKFKIGDVIEDTVGTIAKVIQYDSGRDEFYRLIANNRVWLVDKSNTETYFKLVNKQKSLFEQSLNLVGLEVGDNFYFGTKQDLYMVLNDAITIVRNHTGDVGLYYINGGDILIKILLEPEKIRKLPK